MCGHRLSDMGWALMQLLAMFVEKFWVSLRAFLKSIKSLLAPFFSRNQDFWHKGIFLMLPPIVITTHIADFAPFLLFWQI